MISPFISAFLASMLHVISGPDHLAAVTPLSIQANKRSWLIGFFWGVGHVFGMLIIGVLFYFFKEYIPIETISEYSEQLVAFILIGVGFISFYRIFNENKKKNYPHLHNKEVHIHKHEEKTHTHSSIVKQNIFSSFSIGFIHGLAGVAHFILLLPVLSFSSKYDSYIYIVGFIFGTITAMTTYAIILGRISLFIHQKETLFKGFRFAGGLFAIVIGFYWLYLSF